MRAGRQPISIHFAGRVWLAVFLLAACGLGWWSQSDEGSPRAAANAAVAAALGEQPPLLRIKPIEDIRLGERMEGRNPHRDDVALAVPDEAMWRTVRLGMRKVGGGRLWIELLRPLDWIEAVGAEPGATIALDLPEMGAAGDAVVSAIEPCPAIEPDDDDGRPVVTGRFVHEADGSGVVALRLEGQTEATGVTANHLYWSAERLDFVPAGELRVGEFVDTVAGPRRVAGVSPLDYRGLLYNLETTEHVYRVDALGTLVHNAYPNLTKFDFGAHLRALKGAPPKGMVDPHAHHILFKKGLGAKQRRLVREGQAILRRAGIDPLYGKANLIWAPNRIKGQHGLAALRNVVKQLRNLEKAGGDHADFVLLLRRLGQVAADRR